MPIIKLSIIIPCYNVEKYIGECLDSIYDQNIPQEEFEVICVNDGSLDKTQFIIQNYQEKYKNLTLINHQINRSGTARNTGLKAAQGAYIWFIDSDDWIRSNCFLDLVTLMVNYNLDILNFNFTTQKSDNSYITEYSFERTETIPGDTFFHLNLKEFWKNGSVCRRIYNHDFLKSLNITFSEIGYMQDTVFSLRTVFYSNRFKQIDDIIYFYRWNDQSIQKSKWGAHKSLAVCKVISELMIFSSEIHSKDSVFAECVNELALFNVNRFLKWFLYLNYKERSIAYSILKKHRLEILKSGYLKGWRYYLLSKMNWAIYILFIFSPVLDLAKKIKRLLQI